MGQPQTQINAVTDNSELLLRTINAAPAGSADTSIMRFDTVVTAVGTTGMTATTTAANGTIVGLTRGGLYLVSFNCSQSAASTVLTGISLNTTNLTGNPVQGVAGVFNAILQTAPAATVLPVTTSYLVPVTGAEALAGAFLRLHSTDGAGNASGAGDITAATAQVQIRRVLGITF